MPKHQENKYPFIPLAVVRWYMAINIERSHWWPSSWSKCLIDMKCTVMIWRSQVRTYVMSNLGCIILDLKITFLKIPNRYIQDEWKCIYFPVKCHALLSTIIRYFTSISCISEHIRKCIRYTNFNVNSYWLMLKEYKLIKHHKVYLLTHAQGMQTYYTSQGLFTD